MAKADDKRLKRGATRGDDEAGPEDDVEMGFLEHLAELRVRLIKCILALIPGVGFGWYFKEHILAWLLVPMATATRNLGRGDISLHFMNPMDPVVEYLRLSIIAGILGAAPVIFWQLWSFIAPGLYRRERRLAIPFVLASTLLFVGGALFGYQYVFPPGLELFMSFGGEVPGVPITLEPTITIKEYLDFASGFLLAFGATFEVPVVVTFLAAAQIVNWRQLMSFGRWWVVIASVLAAVLTPPDVGMQLTMLAPLVLLYYVGVVIAFFIGPKAPKPEKKKPARKKTQRAEAEAE